MTRSGPNVTLKGSAQQVKIPNLLRAAIRMIPYNMNAVLFISSAYFAKTVEVAVRWKLGGTDRPSRKCFGRPPSENRYASRSAVGALEPNFSAAVGQLKQAAGKFGLEGLEIEFQAKLHTARVLRCSCGTECTAESWTQRIPIRVAEERVIPGVKKLPSKLNKFRF